MAFTQFETRKMRRSAIAVAKWACKDTTWVPASRGRARKMDTCDSLRCDKTKTNLGIEIARHDPLTFTLRPRWHRCQQQNDIFARIRTAFSIADCADGKTNGKSTTMLTNKKCAHTASRSSPVFHSPYAVCTSITHTAQRTHPTNSCSINGAHIVRPKIVFSISLCMRFLRISCI